LWLKTIRITEGQLFKKIDFSKGINHIFSRDNHYGKTLLLRFILYGLGFPIPNLDGVSLKDCQINLIMIDGAESIEVKRHGKDILVSGRKIESNYVLPRETHQVLRHIFNIDNYVLLDNILGSMFVEQSRGWTLYNQGNVIGDNRFLIDDFVKSFSYDDIHDLIEQKKILKKELDKYKKLLSLLGDPDTLDTFIDKTDLTEIESIQSRINMINFQISSLNKEKRRLEDSRRNNKKFLEYVDKMKLVISIDGKEYRLQSNMIVSSEDTTNLVNARLQNVNLNIKYNQRELNKLQSDLDKKLESNTGDKLIKSLSITPVSELKIDASRIRSMEKLTENAITAVQRKIDNTSADESIIETIDQFIKDNLRTMNLAPEKFFKDVDEICMMHKELKRYAGTYLLLIVLAFRLSYLSTISQQIGIDLPLIIDSPRNGELDTSNMTRVIKILNEYGKKYQIIIASIDPLENLNVDNRVTLDSFEKLVNDSIDPPYFE